jgi:hypothetical protein
MTLWGKYVADHGLVSASSVDLNVVNWSSSIKDLCSGTAIDIGYPTLSITGPPPLNESIPPGFGWIYRSQIFEVLWPSAPIWYDESTRIRCPRMEKRAINPPTE